MRIGVDIDGVVSDSYTAWIRKMNQDFGTNILELKNYDMHLDFGVSWEQMEKYFIDNVAHLFEIPDPVEGAKEGLEKLLRQGHEIIYVTARSPEEKDYTLRWMQKHNIPQEEILFTGFKSKVEFALQRKLELFIEDNPNNAKALSEAGIPVLLMNASYNQVEMPVEVIRCHGWSEILEEIERRALLLGN